MESIRRHYLLYRAGLYRREILVGEIWKTYHPRLQGFVENLYSGEQESCDLVSEILLRALESLDSYNSRYAFSTWIYTLARNHTVDRIRREAASPLRVVPGAEELPEGRDEHSPEILQMEKAGRQEVRRALRLLSDADRELVYLRFYEDMGYRQISGITGRPLGTVKYRMSEIRKILSRELEDWKGLERRRHT
jgi:RNA polymerase sigma-70 factor (ECF subfamily)